MATKKEKKKYTTQSAVSALDDVIKRSELDHIYRSGGDLYTINDDGHNVVVILEPKLYDEVKGRYEELVPSGDRAFIYDCVNTLKGVDEWTEIDGGKLYTGETVKVMMGTRPLNFNKGLMPLRLRKAEFKDISYTTQAMPYPILAVRKYFPSQLDDYGFTLVKVFKIL